MAEQIRGLTIKFDADTSAFNKGLRAIDKETAQTQRQIKALQEGLTLKFDESKFIQAQGLIQKSLEGTERKAALLRERLAYMESAGVTDKTRAEYERIQTVLMQTETQALKTGQKLQDFDKIKLNNLTAEIDKGTERMQAQFEELQRGLAIEFDESKFTQYQELIQKSLEATGEKAALLRERLSAIESAGVTDKTRAEYESLQAAITKAETQASKLNQQLKDGDKIRFHSLTEGIDKETLRIQKQLEALQEGLAIKFDASKLTQAQGLLQKSLEATEKKAALLRERLTAMESAGVTKKNTAEYERLKTELVKTETQALKLNQQLKDLDKLKLNNLTAGIDKVGKSLTSAGKALAPFSALAAGILAGGAKLAKDAANDAAEIQNLADSFNVSAESIQRWQYIALQTGASSGKVEQGLSKIQKALGNQLAGQTDKATEALNRLGISYEKYKDPDQAFEATLRALSQVKDATEQAYLMNNIFGEGMATELTPLVKDGARAVSQYTAEFKEVGYLTNRQISELAELDKSVNKVSKQWENAKTQLAVAMIPILEFFVDLLQNHIIPAVKALAEWFDNLSPSMQKTIIGILSVIAVIAPLLILFGKMASGVSALIKILPNFSKVMEILGTKAGRAFLSFAAFAYAFKLISDVMDAWGDMNGFQKMISILGILTIVALGAAIALGAFHSAWSFGLAAAGIVAGIVAVTAAVNSAKNSVEGLNVPDQAAPNVTGGGVSASLNLESPVPSEYGGGETYTASNYSDNSTTNIYIQKNEYMTEDDIIRAVNKGLQKSKQARA